MELIGFRSREFVLYKELQRRVNKSFFLEGFGVNNGSIWKSNYPFITLSNEKKERRSTSLADNSGQLNRIGRLSGRWQSRRRLRKMSIRE